MTRIRRLVNWLGPKAKRPWNNEWLTRRLSRRLAPAAYAPADSRRAERRILPCKWGNVKKKRRVTRPHGPSGKLFTGTLPKAKQTPRRRWNFQEGGMSNSWRPWVWVFRETSFD